MLPTEKCWISGEFTDECNCDFCEHKYECSGADENYDED